MYGHTPEESMMGKGGGERTPLIITELGCPTIDEVTNPF